MDAKLELGVGENYASVQCNLAGSPIEGQAQFFEGVRNVITHDPDHVRIGDVFIVVANRSLCSRGKENLGKAVTLLQSGGEGEPADGLRLDILFPPTSGQVAPNDALHREHTQRGYDHRTRCQLTRWVFASEVVWHVGKLAEPPGAQRRQDFSFTGHLWFEDVVKSTDAVACHHQ